MPEISPALLLTEYWSAFPSGMTVLSQMPPFLRFDLRLFSEGKVMQNEIIHRYCPHLTVCKGHYPWRRLCKNQWNCRSIRYIVYKFQCQVWIRSSFFGFGDLNRSFIRYPKSKQCHRYWKCGFWSKFPFSVLNFHTLTHIYYTKFPQYLKNFNKSPIFNHTETGFSGKS